MSDLASLENERVEVLEDSPPWELETVTAGFKLVTTEDEDHTWNPRLPFEDPLANTEEQCSNVITHRGKMKTLNEGSVLCGAWSLMAMLDLSKGVLDNLPFSIHPSILTFIKITVDPFPEGLKRWRPTKPFNKKQKALNILKGYYKTKDKYRAKANYIKDCYAMNVIPEIGFRSFLLEGMPAECPYPNWFINTCRALSREYIHTMSGMQTLALQIAALHMEEKIKAYKQVLVRELGEERAKDIASFAGAQSTKSRRVPKPGLEPLLTPCDANPIAVPCTMSHLEEEWSFLKQPASSICTRPNTPSSPFSPPNHPLPFSSFFAGRQQQPMDVANRGRPRDRGTTEGVHESEQLLRSRRSSPTNRRGAGNEGRAAGTREASQGREECRPPLSSNSNREDTPSTQKTTPAAAGTTGTADGKRQQGK
nr:uncharacterized protein LOC128690323 isoform X5 [Cherax quadricarinatus]